MIPSFYDSSKCGTMFSPDTHGAALAGRDFAKANNIVATAADKNKRIVLSLIDMQADFINPASSNVPGNLAVPGAVADVDRVNQFIFANVEKIAHIFATLDTHYLYQCFHPLNWIAGANSNVVHSAGPKKGQPYQEGEHPDPFTLIPLADIRSDAWRPARLANRMMKMVEKLESEGKKTLCIWPIHCELGTPGHALDPTLMEAIHFHAGCRSDQYDLTQKGMSQSSEHYGALQAEVTFADDDKTTLNMDIVNKWQNADRIYFAGQAKSHCVLETLNQAVAIFQQRSPEVLQRLFVLEDCMSSVPDIIDDAGNVIVAFDQIANDRFKELAALGVQFVKSTDPISI